MQFLLYLSLSHEAIFSWLNEAERVYFILSMKEGTWLWIVTRNAWENTCTFAHKHMMKIWCMKMTQNNIFMNFKPVKIFRPINQPQNKSIFNQISITSLNFSKVRAFNINHKVSEAVTFIKIFSQSITFLHPSTFRHIDVKCVCIII